MKLKCQHRVSAVVDSRRRPDGSTRRRRKCLGCGTRWSTIERDIARALEPPAPQVLTRLAVLLDAKGRIVIEAQS